MNPENPLFSHQEVRLDLLRERAFNLRWATQAEDVIPLTAADPDFPVAPAIRKAIQDYAASGVFSYGPGEGLPGFRKSAANMLRQRKGIACTWEEVFPTNSAAFAMFLTAQFALKQGEEAIIFDPVDFLFKASVENAGGIVRLCPIDSNTRSFDPAYCESLVNEKTRMICICNPHNPSGHVLTREELVFLGELAVKHDLWIMSDEIWSDIVYPPHFHLSIASLDIRYASRTISIFGLSKSFGLAGLRVGFLVAPSKETFRQLVELSKVGTTAYGVATLSQVAAQAAYEHAWPWQEAFLAHLHEMRDYTAERLKAIPGINLQVPEGCYVMFPEISSFGMTSQEMADYLLSEAKVAVVPGMAKWFGPGAEGHIRICFSTSKEILRESLDRLEVALLKLRG